MTNTATQTERKDVQVQVRITKTEQQALTEAANTLGVPASVIIRQAIKRKIADINKQLNRGSHSISITL